MEENKLLDVEIVTPQEVIFTGRAISVSLPGSKSPFQVLNMHAPIVSTLDIGLTKIVDDNEKELVFATGSGFTEVHQNKLSILVENAINAKDINTDEVNSELQHAKEMIKNTDDIPTVKTKILEAENKLRAAEKA
jgi:F-type H+-transporting ATPase subunit epsilon